MRTISLVISLGIVMGCAAFLDAQCVVNISTGYDQIADAVLLEGDTDDDYTVDDGLDGPVPALTGGAGQGFPFPAWVANDEDSLWISPSADAVAVPGRYTYEIVVDLDDAIAAPAEMILLGAMASDDSTIDILINSEPTGVVVGGFGAMGDIPAGTGFGLFQPGENVIQFIIDNGGVDANPAGLRVDACIAVGSARARPYDISTGFDQTTVTAIGGGLPDDDYTISGPLGEGTATVVVDDDFPIPPWAANTIQSRWIGTDADDSSSPAGETIFKIVVNLPGEFPAEDAVIVGGFTADDQVVDVLVNNQSTGITAIDFAQLTNFPLNAGRGLFVTGDNSVEFIVPNETEGPTGLRVDAQIVEGPPAIEAPPTRLTLDTGFDDATGLTIPNSQPDDNYVIYGPGGSGIVEFATVVPDDIYPIPPWMASTAQSKWIGTADVSSNGPAGLYTFQVHVEVPEGMDAASLYLIGGWASDNGGLDVRLNDVSIGAATDGNFAILHPFPDAAGLGLFQTGINTIEFDVLNAEPDGNPVGLRVEAIVGTGQDDPTDQSTGIGPRGIGPLPGGADDTRYVVTGPVGSGIGPRPAVVIPADGSPIPPWIANDANSQWIGLDGDNSEGPTGTYTYDLTIDIPAAFNANRVVLTGRWAAAGSGVDVLLNETSLDMTSAGPESMTAFPSDAGEGLFRPGSNILRFVVDNPTAGSTGLRVEARLDIVIRTDPLDISTGFNQESGLAFDEGTADDDYTVTDPFLITEQALVAFATDPAVTSWMPNTPTSHWIGLAGGLAATPGSYRYEMIISLTEEQAAEASIVGFWAADNSGNSLLINEVETGLVTTGGFVTPTVFPDGAGEGLFVAGDNSIAFVVENAGVDPNASGLRVDAVIQVESGGGDEVRFVRGDGNSDGNINLTDGIYVLNYLYLGAIDPACMDAADVDDDGGALPTITDAIRLFNWLFIGGPPPAAPAPSTANYGPGDCGIDETDDQMDCKQTAAKCE